MRIKPYPPSFSSTAAKIIDPAIGASTCALGSHRCEAYMGSFTKNPRIKHIHVNEDVQVLVIWYIISIFKDFEFMLIWRIINNIGRDAVIVYIIKYILA